MVKLREVLPGDLPIFFEQQLDPVARRMAASPPRDQEAFDQHWKVKVLGDPQVLVRTILEDGGVAGNIGSYVRDGRRLLGYWLGREFWGRGVATAALAAFLLEDKSRPLHAITAVTNGASGRVLQKCGFSRVGGVTVADDGVEEPLFRLDASGERASP